MNENKQCNLNSEKEKRNCGIHLLEQWIKEIGDSESNNRNFDRNATHENNKSNYWNSLPDTLTALEISQFLKISRRRVYELFQIHVDAGGIPNYEIGASKRVDKNDFKDWIDCKKEGK